MKKLLLLLAAVLLSGCCVFMSAGQRTNQEALVKMLEEETVALVVQKDNGDWFPYCSAVWVSRDAILTAEHCVDDLGTDEEMDEDELSAWDPVGQMVDYRIVDDVTGDHTVAAVSRRAEVVAIDKDHDLALLRATPAGLPEGHSSAWIARGPIYDGGVVHTVGHTMTLWWTYMQGTVSSSRDNFDTPFPDRKMRVLQVNATVFKGNSGGGAFNADGELIGVCSFVAKWPGISFYIHRDSVLVFLQQNRVVK